MQEIETMYQDIRYGCRSLLRSPGFTVIVIATLGLGIGTNITMFTLMRAVLWRPLPYPEPNRIVTIRVDARNVANTGATRRELLSLEERSRSFEAVSTIDELDANIDHAGVSEYVPAANISDNFLPLLGARPVLGRMLDSSVDAREQQPLAILISDRLWRRKFAADPGVIGKSIRVNDVAVQIAGVLPPGFRLFLPPSVTDLERIDIWFPYRIDPTVPYRGVAIIARLRRGVTLDQANAELQTLAAQFERENPAFYSGPNGWQASPFDRGPGAKVHFTARLLHDEITRESSAAVVSFIRIGGVRTRDRLCECCQSAARARLITATRVGRSAGAWGSKDSNCSATPYRELRARSCLRCGRSAQRALRAESNCASERLAFTPASKDRNRRTSDAFRPFLISSDQHPVWLDAGMARDLGNNRPSARGTLGNCGVSG
ncbi:MAG: ABC transporter permease, partial [Bryobacteraceae bacterium]